VPKVNLRLDVSGVRLEPVKAQHLQALRDGFSSGVSAPTTRWHLPGAIPDARKTGRTLRRYAIVREGTVIGTCGWYRGSIAGLELVIAIFARKNQDRGIGTAVVRKLCEIAFVELKAHRLELGVYDYNKRAIHVYRKCGFRREARLRNFIYNDGHWRDAIWMSRLRGEADGGRR
jgi:RimJ/RimL family protein N-acetyltransferase